MKKERRKQGEKEEEEDKEAEIEAGCTRTLDWPHNSDSKRKHRPTQNQSK